jgi:hypothetical protein
VVLGVAVAGLQAGGVSANIDGQWTRRLSASVVTPKSFELQFLGRQALGARSGKRGRPRKKPSRQQTQK